MNRTQLLIGLIAIAVVALGVATYFVFFGPSAGDTMPLTSDPKAITVGKDDRTLGSPKAPVTVIEYAAPTCPHCAHFDMDVFPDFKRLYIDTGKVYFIFRVFPLNPVDVAAESMARCLPAENYFSFLDLLYRNQPQWDPDGYAIPDVHAALIHMGSIAGLNAQQVDGCINDQTKISRIQGVGTDAQAKYGIYQTPSFVVNGVLHNPITLADLQGIIDPLLAKK